MDDQDIINSIVSRKYLIGTCFLCQICIRCKVDQTFLDCNCELEKSLLKKAKTIILIQENSIQPQIL